MDIGTSTHPGNRYLTLNQDYAVTQEFFAESPRAGQEQVYAAVLCDGHGMLGDKAAAYAGKALIRHLYNSTLRTRPLRDNQQEVARTMQAGFLKGHQAALSIYDDPPSSVQYPVSGQRMGTYSLASSSGLAVYRDGTSSERLLEFGCTCTCALIQGRTVCLANVGDSAAVLGSDTGTSYHSTTLSALHNGRNPAEASRIRAAFDAKTRIAADGYLQVIDGPWMGYELAVSRALGHKLMSNFGVIPDPHAIVLETKPEDCCLVLASDGVWDVMDGQEVVNRVMDDAGEGKSAAQIAERLVKDAVELGLSSPSREADNTSAIVVLLE